jgi:hypothetical protein
MAFSTILTIYFSAIPRAVTWFQYFCYHRQFSGIAIHQQITKGSARIKTLQMCKWYCIARYKGKELQFGEEQGGGGNNVRQLKSLRRPMFLLVLTMMAFSPSPSWCCQMSNVSALFIDISFSLLPTIYNYMNYNYYICKWINMPSKLPGNASRSSKLKS